jgi:predicted RNase H-like nuclease (RuvC/YqgF family)
MSDRYIVIHPDTLEAMRRAGHVAKLEARIEKLEGELHHCFHRIEELQAALRQIIQEDALTGKTVFVGDFGKIARKALEGKEYGRLVGR